jgi:hypothetical protein
MPDPRDLYLDLLKVVLCRDGFADPVQDVRPTGWKGRLFEPVARELNRRNYRLVLQRCQE